MWSIDTIPFVRATWASNGVQQHRHCINTVYSCLPNSFTARSLDLTLCRALLIQDFLRSLEHQPPLTLFLQRCLSFHLSETVTVTHHWLTPPQPSYSLKFNAGFLHACVKNFSNLFIFHRQYRLAAFQQSLPECQTNYRSMQIQLLCTPPMIIIDFGCAATSLLRACNNLFLSIVTPGKSASTAGRNENILCSNSICHDVVF